MSDQAKQEVNRMEDRRLEAMLKNDFAALETLLSDDLTYTHSSAKVDTKASFITALKSGQVKYKKVDREDTRIHVFGTVAIVTGRARVNVVVQGEDKHIDLRYSDAWFKKGDSWQFVLWHATPVPKPA
jgi:ketosteroid isomerase-like protein